MPIPTETEQRRFWRLQWLSSLQAFCDTETQNNRWLDPQERNPHYSYVECMCSYFDDAYLGEEQAYLRRRERGHVTAQEVEAVVDFHQLAAAYAEPGGDAYDVTAILSDPGWQDVVAAAQRAQRRLAKLVDDRKELDALTKPLAWKEDGSGFRADLTGSAIVR